MPFDRLKRRDFITLLGAAAAVMVTAPLLATGQDYPNRSVTLIVNFPPGGSTDAMARIIREPLSQALGQSIIIDNRGGAGGTTGAVAVANARPDGYTLLLSANSPLTTNKYLQKNFPFDPKTAFAPITLTSDVALVLAVHPSLPVHDVTGLIEYARKNPGKLAYATPGIGSSHHVCGELLKQKVGIDMVHVPYRGGALAMQDLLAGNVKVGFYTLPVALPQAQAGAIRVIAAAATPRIAGYSHDRRDRSRRHQRRLERPAGARRNAGADHRQAQCGGGGSAEDAGHRRQDEASGPAPTEQHAGGIRQPSRQRGRPLGEGHSIDWHSAGIAGEQSCCCGVRADDVSIEWATPPSMGSADEFVIGPATGFGKTVVETSPCGFDRLGSFAARLLLEDDHENPVYHRSINAGGGSAWWRCDPSSACASQAAGLYDRHQRGQQPGGLRKRIRFACAEIGQRSRRRICRGGTGNADRRKPTSRAGCDPSLAKHGGAPSLAQLSRLSGRAQDRREIRQIQHCRGQWPEIAVAHSRPRGAKGDPDLGGRDADSGRLWHVRRLMTLGITVRNG